MAATVYGHVGVEKKKSIGYQINFKGAYEVRQANKKLKKKFF